jgi:hypothetical protein
MYLATVVALAALTSGGAVPAGLAAYPDTVCPSRNVPIEGRKSPLDSLTFTIDRQPVKVCYGRPSARGRTMLGGASIPFGKLWRTGANEPTVFYAPVPLRVAGLNVPPGVYSLYTVPGPKEWEVIVNRSISQWGHEGEYTDKIKAQELGRAKVKSEALKTPADTFTITAEPAGDKAVSLLLDWEKTRVRIPVQLGK